MVLQIPLGVPVDGDDAGYVKLLTKHLFSFSFGLPYFYKSMIERTEMLQKARKTDILICLFGFDSKNRK
jgi:hypothetical protein